MSKHKEEPTQPLQHRHHHMPDDDGGVFVNQIVQPEADSKKAADEAEPKEQEVEEGVADVENTPKYDGDPQVVNASPTIPVSNPVDVIEQGDVQKPQANKPSPKPAKDKAKK